MEEADFFAIDELREVSKSGTERVWWKSRSRLLIPAPSVADAYLIDALFTLRTPVKTFFAVENGDFLLRYPWYNLCNEIKVHSNYAPLLIEL